jgi:DNA-binding transcriptional MocR family regulator
MLAAGMHPDAVDCVAAVALYVGQDGRACPSLRTVAADTGRHTDRIRDAIAEAEELGLVVVRRRNRSASTYLFGFQAPRFAAVPAADEELVDGGRWLPGSGWLTG